MVMRWSLEQVTSKCSHLGFRKVLRYPQTSASGLGKACAHAYAAEGAAGVVFADLDKDTAEKAAAESVPLATNPKYRPIAVQVDVTDESSVDNMVSEMVETFGRVDYAVNCAGVYLRGFPWSISDSD